MKRRTLLLSAAALGITGLGAYAMNRRMQRMREPLPAPPGVPRGPHGRDSTAEEVTAGVDLSGKTLLITGVNSGLGEESLRVLTLRGAHVIGTARTLEKAREACAPYGDRATPVALELTDFDSVVACTEAVQRLGVPLDGILCNAGVMALPELEQVNGLEKHFVTNHLGHFLLVNRLRGPLLAAPQGRVVVVSSNGYRWAPEEGIEFDNLAGDQGPYEPNRAYGQSKLANGLFSLELARRLEGTPATSNSVHPGVINTNLGRHFAQWKLVAADLIGWTFMKSVGAGAATQCYVMTAPALAGVSGRFFADCNPAIPGGHMEDAALARRLWEESEAIVSPWLA